MSPRPKTASDAAILEAAARLLARHGPASLRLEDVAREVGLSPATLLLRPLNVETLATYIYQFATRGDFEEGSLAALLIVLVGIVPVIRMVRHADEVMHAGVTPAKPLPV